MANRSHRFQKSYLMELWSRKLWLLPKVFKSHSWGRRVTAKIRYRDWSVQGGRWFFVVCWQPAIPPEIISRAIMPGQATQSCNKQFIKCFFNSMSTSVTVVRTRFPGRVDKQMHCCSNKLKSVSPRPRNGCLRSEGAEHENSL